MDIIDFAYILIIVVLGMSAIFVLISGGANEQKVFCETIGMEFTNLKTGSYCIDSNNMAHEIAYVNERYILINGGI